MLVILLINCPIFSKYLFTFSITNYKREKQTLIMLMFISNNI